MSPRPTGASVLCAALERLGTTTVFGLPGGANTHLYEALSASPVRSVVATHELAAAFMANGYARATGAVGTLVAIPGPGVAYALAGLIEARHDSTPLLAIVGSPAYTPGRRFQLQAFDQAAVAGPVVKDVLDVASGAELARVVAEAHELALADEPGPVLLHVPRRLLAGTADPPARRATARKPAAPTAGVDDVAKRLRQSARPVLLLGQGAQSASGSICTLAASIGAAVLTTSSGRGTVPEDEPHVIPIDDPGAGPGPANELLAAADLVVAIGCKLSHNGTFGFSLRLPVERLVHVDASQEVLGANYPASIAIRSDASAFVEALTRALAPYLPRSGWPADELARFRERALTASGGYPEPLLLDLDDRAPAAFFGALRAALPREGILVTDSGHHQLIARRHYVAASPRSLIAPSDFQAMGFGLPAAIGAAIAAPARPVVALVGDGGLAVSGLELITAVRERVPLTVIVLKDGHFQLIRLQQLGESGREHGTRLGDIDVASLAAAVGARHERVIGDPAPALERALAHDGVDLLELVLADSPALGRLRARGRIQRAARSMLGPDATGAVKRRLRRG